MLQRCKYQIALFVAFVSTTTAFADGSKLKIGAILPLTGSAQLYGVPCKNGIDLALRDLQKEFNGDQTLEVTYEDDGFQPARTVTAFKKLVDQDHVDLVIAIASTPSNSIAPLAEAKQVPLFGWASDTKVSFERKFVVRTAPSGYQEGKKLAEYSLQKGFTKAASVTSINDYPASVRSGFLGVFGDQRIVLAEEFSTGTADFHTFISRLKRASPSVIFLCLNPGENSIFARQLVEYNTPIPLVGCENLDDITEYQRAAGGLDHARFVTGAVSREFFTRYTKEFKNEGTITGASVHYDVIRVLDTLLRNEGRHLRKKEFLDRMFARGEYTGTIGKFQVVSRNADQYFDYPLVIRELKNGEFVDVVP